MVYTIVSIDFITALCLPLGNYEAIDKNLNHKTGIVVGWSMTKQGLFFICYYYKLFKNVTIL